MSTAGLPLHSINGLPLSDEQTNYLTGFFAGFEAGPLRAFPRSKLFGQPVKVQGINPRPYFPGY